jgi:uncharacterized membrane protein YfcA
MSTGPSISPAIDMNKVVGGLQGGGAGATIATIFVWFLGTRGIVIPPEIAVAFSALFTMATGAIGTYLKPHNS